MTMSEAGTFSPIIGEKFGKKTYTCPICNNVSHTAPMFPNNPNYFVHKKDCANKNKNAVECSHGGKRTKYKSKRSMRKNKRNTKNKQKRRQNM